VFAPLPADLYFWQGPHSYTGQDLVELHTLGCPPLVERAIAELLAAGARAARPGEFTLRAFLAGKLDLTRAEAGLGVLQARSRGELKQALAQLAGGVARPLQELRDDLLNLLADVEAGLDFSDEDLNFVGRDDLLKRLGKGLALVTNLGRQLEQRAVTERPFRIVLGGLPNAGKSSLFNALAGARALVSPQPRTTRDYLVYPLALAGVNAELVDTAGWHPANGEIEEQAQALGREQAEQADLVVLCHDVKTPVSESEKRWLAQDTPAVLGVVTKCDQAEGLPGWLSTSAVTGFGLEALRRRLADHAQAHARPALAPSLSRCRHHVASCLEALRRAPHSPPLDAP